MTKLLKTAYRHLAPIRLRDSLFLWRHRLFLRKPRSYARHKLPGHLIVSLTSHAARFPVLALTIRALLDQTVGPDLVVLCIDKRDENRLPANVLALQKRGLVIVQGEDIRSYNKIMPALDRWPDSFIAVADDDVAYPSDWLSDLVSDYRPQVAEILFLRGHRITVGPGNMPLGYEKWDWETKDTGPSRDLFPTGVGGVLYPPGILHSDATDRGLFTKLCPTADDVWLYWMARLNGVTFRRVGTGKPIINWPTSQTVGLAQENADAAQGNDAQIARMVSKYGFAP